MTNLLLILLLSMPAQGVELSLEENRAERGNIGFLDMKKVFALYPETARAREIFEESVRQAEEQVNLRKNELLRLRSELAQMKSDREVLASAPQQPIGPAQPPAPTGASERSAGPTPKAAQPAQPAPEPSQTQRPAVSTTVASLPGLMINLPGATTAPVVVQEPQGEPGVVTPIETPPAPPPQPDPIAETPVIAPSTAPAPAPQTPLQLLDQRIADREAEIKRKELEYKEHRANAEKNLLDLEDRRSQQLLGKIYRAVQEVARKEGVSVVVDKSAILYGHGAVDLTDKVLKQLRGS